MAFHNIQFPDELSYGAVGGPAFNTTIVATKGGRESRNQNWSAPRVEWDVSTSVKDAQSAEDLISFFRARAGQVHGFRFKDWSDYTLTDESMGTGNASQTDFQLLKTYEDAISPTVRTITKPVDGTLSVSIDGVVQSEANYSVDYDTGIVSFNSAPGSGLVVSATGEFDFPARFATDKLRINIVGFDAYVGDSITIIEILDE